MTYENDSCSDPTQALPPNDRMYENNDSLDLSRGQLPKEMVTPGNNENPINNTLPWTYDGKPIVPYTGDEPYGAAQITSWVLRLASNSNSSSVQTMMEGVLGDKKLQREIVPKQARKTILVKYKPQMPALFAYMFIQPTNTGPCGTCSHMSSSGPCVQCIAGKIGGKLVFGGACTNCFYSGHRLRCSLIPKPDAHRPSQESGQGSFLDRILMAADPDDLEQLRRAVDSALARKKASMEPRS